MKTTILILAGLQLISTATATWCNFYYDGGCTNDSNGGTSYDCANGGSFGSGGGFVKCHATTANNRDCNVLRCTNSGCGTIAGGVKVSPYDSCKSTGGAGPYYKLSLLNS